MAAVRFLWDCVCETVERSNSNRGGGCIVAHCMGLGKTLSVTATLLLPIPSNPPSIPTHPPSIPTHSSRPASPLRFFVHPRHIQLSLPSVILTYLSPFSVLRVILAIRHQVQAVHSQSGSLSRIRWARIDCDGDWWCVAADLLPSYTDFSWGQVKTEEVSGDLSPKHGAQLETGDRTMDRWSWHSTWCELMELNYSHAMIIHAIYIDHRNYPDWPTPMMWL